MLRELLSSRAIQVGLVVCVLIVCVLIVGGSLLHFLYVKRTTDAEFPRPDAVRVNDQAVTQDTDGTSLVDFGQTAPGLDTDETQTMSDDSADTETSQTDTETLDSTDPIETDTVSADEPAEEAAVSPFGFGPYPEVPEGYSFTFPASSPEHELMMRVEIKLISQGVNVKGSSMRDGLIYPTIPGTAYVQWKEYERPEGSVRYIGHILSTGGDGARLHALRLFGRWSAEASCPNDFDGPSGLVRGDVYEAASASFFERTSEAPDASGQLGRLYSKSKIEIKGHISDAAANVKLAVFN